MRAVLKGSSESRLHIGPSTSIHRLLLSPNNLSIRILVSHLSHTVEGEGGDLLNTDQGDFLGFLLHPSPEKGVIDLAAAEDDLLGLFNGVIYLLNDTDEAGSLLHIIKGGSGHGIAKKILGEEKDQRLAEVAVDLPAEDMEEIGRGRGVNNLKIAVLDLPAALLLHLGEDVGMVVAELEEALYSPA